MFIRTYFILSYKTTSCEHLRSH